MEKGREQGVLLLDHYDELADHPEKLDERLELQRRGAMAEKAEAYRALIR